MTKALEECQGALDLQPNFPAALDEIIPVYTIQKRFSEAIEATFKYPDPSDNDSSLQRAYVYTVAGEKDRAEEIVRRVTSAPGSYSAYNMATICAAAYQQDEALRWLEIAFERHSLSVVWIRVDPRLDNIRSAPPFPRLSCAVGPASPGPKIKVIT